MMAGWREPATSNVQRTSRQGRGEGKERAKRDSWKDGTRTHAKGRRSERGGQREEEEEEEEREREREVREREREREAKKGGGRRGRLRRQSNVTDAAQ